MPSPLIGALPLLGAALLWTGPAAAEALTLWELDELTTYVECEGECALLLAIQPGCEACYGECVAVCPEPDPSWEKNGRPPIDNVDLFLAIYEFLDDGSSQLICHEEPSDGSTEYEIVLPKPLCDLDACTETYTPAQCADVDGDGLPAWIEDLFDSLSDAVGFEDGYCRTNADCEDLSKQCWFRYEVGDEICVDRLCGDNGPAPCTVFHLEQVAVDNQELIVHLYYDYTPIPATVLDLKLVYDQDDLTLLDTRPLPPLDAAGKELHVSHLQNGMLRLVVLSPMSSEPVPYGGIIELVFQRLSTNLTEVSFALDDFSQTHAVAPRQGDATSGLSEDSLWGEKVRVLPAVSTGPRLLLYYAFDNPAFPLAYKDVPSEAQLCLLFASCNNLDTNDPVQNQLKDMYLEQFETLQHGLINGGDEILGVAGKGLYLDGAIDHLRFPVTMNFPDDGFDAEAQDFSLGLWMYTEGPDLDAGSESYQLIYSHNSAMLGSYGRTNFALLLRPIFDADSMALALLDGDALSPQDGLTDVGFVPTRRWTHLGLTVDAGTGVVQVLIDGQVTYQAALSNLPIQCPVEQAEPSGGMSIALEGEGSGGIPPEMLYLSTARSNLYGVEEMDLMGVTLNAVLRDGQHSFQHPDYSPITGKIVYSSNASGNYEIWIADRDGDVASRKQVTVGFGDTSRGVFARYPRWAPDGSGIVFESNVYLMPELGACPPPSDPPELTSCGDNLAARGYHLYYLPFNVSAGVVEIHLENNSIVNQLVYQDRYDDQTIADHRLTDAKSYANYTGVRWLAGKTTTTLGDIVYTASDERFEYRHVMRLVMQDVNQEPPVRITQPDFSLFDDVSLLDAHHDAVTDTFMLQRTWYTYEESGNFTIAVTALDAQSFRVIITHTPNPANYSPTCWDLNESGTCNLSEEDTNTDGNCTIDDCYPFELRNLFLYFDETIASPVLEDSVPGDGLTDQPNPGKQYRIGLQYTTPDSYVQVEVLSPVNNLPLEDGQEITRLIFTGATLEDSDFQLVERVPHDQLYIQRVAGVINQVTPVIDALLDSIQVAAFSPNGKQAVLAGTKYARPVLVRTQNLQTTVGAERILPATLRVSGLDWTSENRYAACNWMGAHRVPISGVFTHALRGGLDEIKMYSYIRSTGAYLSDAGRGHERLVAEGRDGLVPIQSPTCSNDNDLQCPPFHLCVENQCQVVYCDPYQQDPCVRGQCTLRPLVVGQMDSDSDWVCTVECSVDRQCFTQECLNGPCRFCGGDKACIECQETTWEYPNFSITGIEGCPDRNSFACEEGGCVTECYVFDNGQSIYVCDPALEYCKQGRCELLEWSWVDIAPASFSGLNPPIYRSQELKKVYPIAIYAYGVGDYVHPPEVIVEGRYQAVYPDAWFELGRFWVYNRTTTEAGSFPSGDAYELHTSYPVTQLRLRLVVPPYQQLNGGASGLLEREKYFCIADATSWNLAHDPDVDPDEVCYRRPPGSMFHVGYPVGLPWDQINEAKCAAGLDCDDVEDGLRNYLHPGRSTVIVKDIRVNGTSVMDSISSNRICSYEGTTVPLDVDGHPKKMFFGDVYAEQSPEAYQLLHPDGSMNYLAESITANGHEVQPLFMYNGNDVLVSKWAPRNGHGQNLWPSGAMQLAEGMSLLGPNDQYVLSGPSSYFATGPAMQPQIGSDDFAIEVIFKSKCQGFDYVMAECENGPGWRIVEKSCRFRLRMSQGAPYIGVESDTLVPNTWYHGIVFVNRDENSAYGAQWYVNGIASGAGIDPTSISGSLASNDQLWIGALQEMRFAYLAGWTYPNWFPSGAAGPTEWAAIADQRYKALIADQSAAYTHDELIDIAPEAEGDWGLLNCPLALLNDPTKIAGININVPTPYIGSLDITTKLVTGNICLYTGGNSNTLCYEWLSDPSLDAMNRVPIQHQTLDYSGFKSFGFDGTGE